MRAGLQRLAVRLEEEPLVRPQRGVGEVLPHAPCHLGGRQRRIDRRAGQRLALLLLDVADDLDQQALLGAEVVDQHAVAGADRGGESAQAEVGDAVLGDVLDRGLEQPLLRRQSGAAT